MRKNSSLPFFVVGSERSGSTMLRLMLEGHPELAVTPEFEFATEPIKDFRPFPSGEAIKDLSDNWIYRALKLSLPQTDSWPRAMKEILEGYTKRKGAQLQGAVVHKNFEQLPRMFPTAKYIHLVRDPRDVAYSVVKMGWASTVISGVKRWFDAENSWDWLVEGLVPSDFIEVHFEDLVQEPVATLTRICSFLEIPYNPTMLEYDQSSTYSRPDRKISHAWRQRLSEKELGQLEYILGDRLSDRGYTASGVKTMKPSPVFSSFIPVRDWMARFQYRRKLYGTLLLLEDYIARKTKLSASLSNRLQLRMEAIWLASLK